jgi:tetratricopeptide (TPR) repeat protein
VVRPDRALLFEEAADGPLARHADPGDGEGHVGLDGHLLGVLDRALLNTAAWIEVASDEYAAAERRLRAAGWYGEDLPPCGERSDTLYYRSKLARLRGDLDAAERRLTETIDLDRELGNRQNVSSSLKSLGDVARDRGDPETAAQRYRSSLELKRRLGDRGGEADVLRALGEACRRLGRPDAATERLADAVDLAADLGATERRERLRTLRGELRDV